MLIALKNSIIANSAKTAFCIGGELFTYEQLAIQINSIQHVIDQHNITGKRRAGIVLHDDIRTYASILACWFTGYAYIPIHPKIPISRNKLILEQAEVDFLLNSNPENSYFEEKDILTINTSGLKTIESATISYSELPDETLMYILFTSGSTGVPKGVPINYGNVKGFLDSYFHLDFKCNSDDRFLQMFDLTFDVSVASYLVPLLIGASVYTVSSGGIKYMNVYKILKNYDLTFVSLVPSVINYLKPYFNQISLPSLKYCILTAEASDINNIINFSACIPNAKIVNLYGPTEATIWCTAYMLDETNPRSYNNMMSIGKPFKNITAFIRNEVGAEADIGEKGELCIAGNQLTEGYLNNEERNNTAFFAYKGLRFYKTGDLCFIDENGEIAYCGRLDYQVKIQGFRIELNEVELAAAKLFNVSVAAVTVLNSAGVNEICLFLESPENEKNECRRLLEKQLPYYMVPSKIIILQELLYNTSGKIDRAKLKEMATEVK